MSFWKKIRRGKHAKSSEISFENCNRTENHPCCFNQCIPGQRDTGLLVPNPSSFSSTVYSEISEALQTDWITTSTDLQSSCSSLASDRDIKNVKRHGTTCKLKKFLLKSKKRIVQTLLPNLSRSNNKRPFEEMISETESGEDDSIVTVIGNKTYFTNANLLETNRSTSRNILLGQECDLANTQEKKIPKHEISKKDLIVSDVNYKYDKVAEKQNQCSFSQLNESNSYVETFSRSMDDTDLKCLDSAYEEQTDEETRVKDIRRDDWTGDRRILFPVKQTTICLKEEKRKQFERTEKYSQTEQEIKQNKHIVQIQPCKDANLHMQLPEASMTKGIKQCVSMDRYDDRTCEPRTFTIGLKSVDADKLFMSQKPTQHGFEKNNDNNFEYCNIMESKLFHSNPERVSLEGNLLKSSHSDKHYQSLSKDATDRQTIRSNCKDQCETMNGSSNKLDSVESSKYSLGPTIGLFGCGKDNLSPHLSGLSDNSWCCKQSKNLMRQSTGLDVGEHFPKNPQNSECGTNSSQCKHFTPISDINAENKNPHDFAEISQIDGLYLNTCRQSKIRKEDPNTFEDGCTGNQISLRKSTDNEKSQQFPNILKKIETANNINENEYNGLNGKKGIPTQQKPHSRNCCPSLVIFQNTKNNNQMFGQSMNSSQTTLSDSIWSNFQRWQGVSEKNDGKHFRDPPEYSDIQEGNEHSIATSSLNVCRKDFTNTTNDSDCSKNGRNVPNTSQDGNCNENNTVFLDLSNQGDQNVESYSTHLRNQDAYDSCDGKENTPNLMRQSRENKSRPYQNQHQEQHAKAFRDFTEEESVSSKDDRGSPSFRNSRNSLKDEERFDQSKNSSQTTLSDNKGSNFQRWQEVSEKNDGKHFRDPPEYSNIQEGNEHSTVTRSLNISRKDFTNTTNDSDCEKNGGNLPNTSQDVNCNENNTVFLDLSNQGDQNVTDEQTQVCFYETHRTNIKNFEENLDDSKVVDKDLPYVLNSTEEYSGSYDGISTKDHLGSKINCDNFSQHANGGKLCENTQSFHHDKNVEEARKRFESRQIEENGKSKDSNFHLTTHSCGSKNLERRVQRPSNDCKCIHESSSFLDSDKKTGLQELHTPILYHPCSSNKNDGSMPFLGTRIGLDCTHLRNRDAYESCDGKGSTPNSIRQSRENESNRYQNQHQEQHAKVLRDFTEDEYVSSKDDRGSQSFRNSQNSLNDEERFDQSKNCLQTTAHDNIGSNCQRWQGVSEKNDGKHFSDPPEYSNIQEGNEHFTVPRSLNMCRRDFTNTINASDCTKNGKNLPNTSQEGNCNKDNTDFLDLSSQRDQNVTDEQTRTHFYETHMTNGGNFEENLDNPTVVDWDSPNVLNSTEEYSGSSDCISTKDHLGSKINCDNFSKLADGGKMCENTQSFHHDKNVEEARKRFESRQIEENGKSKDSNFHLTTHSCGSKNLERQVQGPSNDCKCIHDSSSFLNSDKEPGLQEVYKPIRYPPCSSDKSDGCKQFLGTRIGLNCTHLRNQDAYDSCDGKENTPNSIRQSREKKSICYQNQHQEQHGKAFRYFTEDEYVSSKGDRESLSFRNSQNSLNDEERFDQSKNCLQTTAHDNIGSNCQRWQGVSEKHDGKHFSDPPAYNDIQEGNEHSTATSNLNKCRRGFTNTINASDCTKNGRNAPNTSQDGKCNKDNTVFLDLSNERDENDIEEESRARFYETHRTNIGHFQEKLNDPTVVDADPPNVLNSTEEYSGSSDCISTKDHLGSKINCDNFSKLADGGKMYENTQNFHHDKNVEEARKRFESRQIEENGKSKDSNFHLTTHSCGSKNLERQVQGPSNDCKCIHDSSSFLNSDKEPGLQEVFKPIRYPPCSSDKSDGCKQFLGTRIGLNCTHLRNQDAYDSCDGKGSTPNSIRQSRENESNRYQNQHQEQHAKVLRDFTEDEYVSSKDDRGSQSFRNSQNSLNDEERFDQSKNCLQTTAHDNIGSNCQRWQGVSEKNDGKHFSDPPEYSNIQEGNEHFTVPRSLNKCKRDFTNSINASDCRKNGRNLPNTSQEGNCNKDNTDFLDLSNERDENDAEEESRARFYETHRTNIGHFQEKLNDPTVIGADPPNVLNSTEEYSGSSDCISTKDHLGSKINCDNFSKLADGGKMYENTQSFHHDKNVEEARKRFESRQMEENGKSKDSNFHLTTHSCGSKNLERRVQRPSNDCKCIHDSSSFLNSDKEPGLQEVYKPIRYPPCSSDKSDGCKQFLGTRIGLNCTHLRNQDAYDSCDGKENTPNSIRQSREKKSICYQNQHQEQHAIAFRYFTEDEYVSSKGDRESLSFRNSQNSLNDEERFDQSKNCLQTTAHDNIGSNCQRWQGVSEKNDGKHFSDPPAYNDIQEGNEHSTATSNLNKCRRGFTNTINASDCTKNGRNVPNTSQDGKCDKDNAVFLDLSNERDENDAEEESRARFYETHRTNIGHFQEKLNDPTVVDADPPNVLNSTEEYSGSSDCISTKDHLGSKINCDNFSKLADGGKMYENTQNFHHDKNVEEARKRFESRQIEENGKSKDSNFHLTTHSCGSKNLERQVQRPSNDCKCIHDSSSFLNSDKEPGLQEVYKPTRYPPCSSDKSDGCKQFLGNRIGLDCTHLRNQDAYDGGDGKEDTSNPIRQSRENKCSCFQEISEEERKPTHTCCWKDFRSWVLEDLYRNNNEQLKKSNGDLKCLVGYSMERWKSVQEYEICSSSVSCTSEAILERNEIRFSQQSKNLTAEDKDIFKELIDDLETEIALRLEYIPILLNFLKAKFPHVNGWEELKNMSGTDSHTSVKANKESVYVILEDPRSYEGPVDGLFHTIAIYVEKQSLDRNTVHCTLLDHMNNKDKINECSLRTIVDLLNLHEDSTFSITLFPVQYQVSNKDCLVMIFHDLMQIGSGKMNELCARFDQDEMRQFMFITLSNRQSEPVQVINEDNGRRKETMHFKYTKDKEILPVR